MWEDGTEVFLHKFALTVCQPCCVTMLKPYRYRCPEKQRLALLDVDPRTKMNNFKSMHKTTSLRKASPFSSPPFHYEFSRKQRIPSQVDEERWHIWAEIWLFLRTVPNVHILHLPCRSSCLREESGPSWVLLHWCDRQGQMLLLWPDAG